MWKIKRAANRRAQALLNPDNYLRYFRHLYFAHFGPLAFWLIAPPALCPWLRAWSRRQSLNASAILLWLNIASALIVLSLILAAKLRATSYQSCPASPSCAQSDCGNTSPRLRRVLGGVWVAVLGTATLPVHSRCAVRFLPQDATSAGPRASTSNNRRYTGNRSRLLGGSANFGNHVPEAPTSPIG
ncbi:MAG: hypothetical protein KatS3mg048_2614 [Caldilinea sp.]|nr:MAG: hypothetical protein KatS3mg048_2614 [Caldilinea sp.]